ncbi:hypothetical protein PSENEW3_00002345 [Picochlorum sp. SENEW3]|nr:hypothetical protein PSENEW3_00002345 [Picochlorum sp. SENEW3]
MAPELKNAGLGGHGDQVAPFLVYRARPPEERVHARSSSWMDPWGDDSPWPMDDSPHPGSECPGPHP